MTNDVPSDEEFERALAGMGHVRWRTDEIAEATHRQFEGSLPLRMVVIFFEDEAEFHLLVFFESDDDVRSCLHDGSVDRIRDFVRQQLQEVRPDCGRELRIRVEVDSHENVQRICGGNYFLRLRMGP